MVGEQPWRREGEAGSGCLLFVHSNRAGFLRGLAAAAVYSAPVDLTWMGSFGEGWFVVGARIETRRRSETGATWTPRLAGSCQAVRSVITGCLQVGVRHCWALVGPGEDAFLHLVRFQFDFPMDHSYQKHTSTA